MYVEQRRRESAKIKVRPTGLYMSPTHSYLGASPHGLIEGEEEDGCLEIYCPFSINGHHVRHVSPQEIADQHLTFFLEKILGRSL